jgi:hypothetical protein
MAGHAWGSTGQGQHHGRSKSRLGRPPTAAQRVERTALEAWARRQPCAACGSRAGVELRYHTDAQTMAPLCARCDDLQTLPF